MFTKITNKLDNALIAAKCRLAAREEGDHLLEVLGTIIIAVVILIFFRSQMVDMFQNAMNGTSNRVNEMFDNVSNTSITTP
jgi:hypothetical protein